MSSLKTILVFLAITSFSAQAEEPFSIETENGSQVLYRKSLALVIGAAKYRFWNTLDSIPQDVANVKKALEKQGFSVRTVLNPDGKKLRQSIEGFLLDRKGSTEELRERRLVIYFAGHGTTDNEYTGYLVPIDAPARTEDANFEQIALGMDVIKTWANRSRAKHILFVFDSCQSGAVFIKRGNISPPNELFYRDIEQPAKYFITSGSINEDVPAISDFTPAFIRGLEGDADLIKDGYVTSIELGEWLKGEIIRKGKQTPQHGSVSEIPSYGQVVFRYSKDSPQKLALSRSNKQSNTADLNPATRGMKETIQLVGEPSDSRGKEFRGIELIYYQKIGDGENIIDSLEKGGIPYFATRLARLPKLKTNAIACAPDTPIEALRILAKTLINDGIKLQAIFQFREPLKKAGSIELVALSEDAKGLEEMKSAPLSIEQIQKLKYCPGSLTN